MIESCEQCRWSDRADWKYHPNRELFTCAPPNAPAFKFVKMERLAWPLRCKFAEPKPQSEPSEFKKWCSEYAKNSKLVSYGADGFLLDGWNAALAKVREYAVKTGDTGWTGIGGLLTELERLEAKEQKNET